MAENDLVERPEEVPENCPVSGVIRDTGRRH